MPYIEMRSKIEPSDHPEDHVRAILALPYCIFAYAKRLADGDGPIDTLISIHETDSESMAPRAGQRRAILVQRELWLVHDRGNRDGKSVAEQYQLFDSKHEALMHATKIGWVLDGLSRAIGISDKIGMANVYMCGLVHVVITRLR